MQIERVHSLDPDAFREFDAHIYFDESSVESAKELRAELVAQFSRERVRVGNLVHRPIGPHPLPMFELNFRREELAAVQAFLESARGQHVVLIHEVTGDDPRDHSTGARWLGPAVALDFSKLDPSPMR